MGNDDLDELRAMRTAYDGDAAASAYVQRTLRPGTRRRLEIADRLIAHHVGSARRCLELGGGHARLLSKTDARTKANVDLSRALLARNPDGIERVLARTAALPFADASFDAVVSGYGGYRSNDLEAVLTEMARVLEDGAAFGLHGLSRLRVGLRPPVRRLHDEDVGPFPETRRTFIRHGLWVERAFYLRGTTRGFRRVPSATWFLASHVVLLGRRIDRAVERQQKATLAALEEGREVRVAIGGGSMGLGAPFGRVLRFRSLAGRRPRPGEIVLILSPQGFVTHRVHASIAGHVLHRGDAASGAPRLARTWRVVGAVV